MSRQQPAERTLVIMLLGSLLFAGSVMAGDAPQSREETLLAGERMYREGILPSGEPMLAIVKGDIAVPGTAFTCVSCHLRAGIGSVEGGVYTPPTNGKSLYRPLKKYYKGVEIKYGEAPFRRPAYTDKTLADLLRGGVDPAGKVMHDIMPRYRLEDGDMDKLVQYLKNLSTDYSPGVTDTAIRFATVISEDANPTDVATMLNGLDKFIADKNGMAANYRNNVKTQRDRLMARAMSTSKEIENRQIVLARWILKGPPASWRQQLEEYNRREPAFVLLGGIVSGEWEPVHRFSEEHKIPCLFPNTDFPVVSETDWYTLYLSKGFYQEGESTARFLNNSLAEGQPGEVIQVTRDTREGRALAAGFRQTWQALGRQPPVTVTLSVNEPLTASVLGKAVSGRKPVALLLWDGPTAITVLKELPATSFMPGMIFLSAGYLGKALWSLPAEVRDVTYLAYPFRLPQDKVIDPMMGKPINFPVNDDRISQQTFSLTQLLAMAVMEIKGNYYRDHFLDVIGMSMDLVVPLFERLSFGPGQRYASKGCYIVQLGNGAKPELVKKSDWVIH